MPYERRGVEGTIGTERIVYAFIETVDG